MMAEDEMLLLICQEPRLDAERLLEALLAGADPTKKDSAGWNAVRYLQNKCYAKKALYIICHTSNRVDFSHWASARKILHGAPARDPSQSTLDEYLLSKGRLPDSTLPIHTISTSRTLTRLNLSHNRLQEIPVGLTKVATLRHLDVSSNLLCCIPSEVAALTGLEELVMSHNIDLAELPMELAFLAPYLSPLVGTGCLERCSLRLHLDGTALWTKLETILMGDKEEAIGAKSVDYSVDVLKMLWKRCLRLSSGLSVRVVYLGYNPDLKSDVACKVGELGVSNDNINLTGGDLDKYTLYYEEVGDATESIGVARDQSSNTSRGIGYCSPGNMTSLPKYLISPDAPSIYVIVIDLAQSVAVCQKQLSTWLTLLKRKLCLTGKSFAGGTPRTSSPIPFLKKDERPESTRNFKAIGPRPPLHSVLFVGHRGTATGDEEDERIFILRKCEKYLAPYVADIAAGLRLDPKWYVVQKNEAEVYERLRHAIVVNITQLAEEEPLQKRLHLAEGNGTRGERSKLIASARTLSAEGDRFQSVEDVPEQFQTPASYLDPWSSSMGSTSLHWSGGYSTGSLGMSTKDSATQSPPRPSSVACSVTLKGPHGVSWEPRPVAAAERDLYMNHEIMVERVAALVRLRYQSQFLVVDISQYWALLQDAAATLFPTLFDEAIVNYHGEHSATVSKSCFRFSKAWGVCWTGRFYPTDVLQHLQRRGLVLVIQERSIAVIQPVLLSRIMLFFALPSTLLRNYIAPPDYPWTLLPEHLPVNSPEGVPVPKHRFSLIVGEEPPRTEWSALRGMFWGLRKIDLVLPVSGQVTDVFDKEDVRYYGGFLSKPLGESLNHLSSDEIRTLHRTVLGMVGQATSEEGAERCLLPWLLPVGVAFVLFAPNSLPGDVRSDSGPIDDTLRRSVDGSIHNAPIDPGHLDVNEDAKSPRTFTDPKDVLDSSLGKEDLLTRIRPVERANIENSDDPLPPGMERIAGLAITPQRGEPLPCDLFARLAFSFRNLFHPDSLMFSNGVLLRYKELIPHHDLNGRSPADLTPLIPLDSPLRKYFTGSGGSHYSYDSGLEETLEPESTESPPEHVTLSDWAHPPGVGLLGESQCELAVGLLLHHSDDSAISLVVRGRHPSLLLCMLEDLIKNGEGRYFGANLPDTVSVTPLCPVHCQTIGRLPLLHQIKNRTVCEHGGGHEVSVALARRGALRMMDVPLGNALWDDLDPTDSIYGQGEWVSHDDSPVTHTLIGEDDSTRARRTLLARVQRTHFGSRMGQSNNPGLLRPASLALLRMPLLEEQFARAFNFCIERHMRFRNLSPAFKETAPTLYRHESLTFLRNNPDLFPSEVEEIIMFVLWCTLDHSDSSPPWTTFMGENSLHSSHTFQLLDRSMSFSSEGGIPCLRSTISLVQPEAVTEEYDFGSFGGSYYFDEKSFSYEEFCARLASDELQPEWVKRKAVIALPRYIIGLKQRGVTSKHKHILAWLDPFPSNNVDLIARISRGNPAVMIICMSSTYELRSYLKGMGPEADKLKRGQNLRLITNRYRAGDGGEMGADAVIHWLSGEPRWSDLPILVYCGKQRQVSHLHDPTHWSWVSTSPEVALRFASFTQPLKPTASALWDTSRRSCSAGGCGKKFGLTRKRRNCARCGGAFCKEHLVVKEDEVLGFEGTAVWVCAICRTKY